MEVPDRSGKGTIAGSCLGCKDPPLKKISNRQFYISPGYHRLFSLARIVQNAVAKGIYIQSEPKRTRESYPQARRYASYSATMGNDHALLIDRRCANGKA